MAARRPGTGKPSEVRNPDAAVPLPILHELLVGIEMVYLRLSPVYWGFGIPPGDGSAVVVIPAFLLTDLYLTEFRSWINRIGYKAYFSEIGRNAECPNLLIQHKLTATIEKAYKETGKKVHLVGHSLGGVIARAAASQMPHRVASVITMGSPFRGTSFHPPRRPIRPQADSGASGQECAAGLLHERVHLQLSGIPGGQAAEIRLSNRHLYQVRRNRGLARLPDRQARRRFRSLGNPHRPGVQPDGLRRCGPPPGGQDPQLGQSRVVCRDSGAGNLACSRLLGGFSGP